MEERIMSCKTVTRSQLAEMEAAPKSAQRLMADYIVCTLPALAASLVLLQFFFIPNYKNHSTTFVYPALIGALGCLLLVMLGLSFFSKKVFAYLRYKAPFYTFVLLAFLGYDYLTLKTGTLMMPYFPWPDKILSVIVEDADILLESVGHSLVLLFTGYFSGAAAGLLSGVACGLSKRVNYWVSPVMKLLGPIPSTTWLPIIVLLASSLFKGSAFLIALGVWYPATLATMTGISSIPRSYFEAARTLGAGRGQLVFKIAVPAALPNIFQGLTQGMSVACTALLVAEMMGVKSGLGWYIVWQKSWAEFSKMYAAVIMICLIFTVVNWALATLRKRVLRWQEPMR